ncbi:hypothetical protein DBR40_07125 [Pedobacter sp. KBW01]|uniref:hypothetical protein n=1 Tax=Pedobacter sp. KBW01 TaxID=2153364 RepID=UPI000F5A806B|nr:hypothetical protein [Pedobacter sp. KBW01]RQO77739.1 hypothetical protein DBR40_07125 [Pedobacter sp. KBW01]
MKEEIEQALASPSEGYLSTTWGSENDGKLVLNYREKKTETELAEIKTQIDSYYENDTAFVVIKELEKSRYFALSLTNLDESKTVEVLSSAPFKYFSDFVKYLDNSKTLKLQLSCEEQNIDCSTIFTVKIEESETNPDGAFQPGFVNEGE